MKFKSLIVSMLILCGSSLGFGFPGAPSDVNHPGSKVYAYKFQTKKLLCSSREVWVFLPVSGNLNQSYPVVVYGHGQALSLKHYNATLEHLAQKGIAAIFPTYDTGFFDQDWQRMGMDYISLTECAILQSGGAINSEQIVFSGHSKGAYVAAIAAGNAYKKKLSIRPQAVVLFAPAGNDESSLVALDPAVEMTVVYSDSDTIVSKKISETIYVQAPSKIKQFIVIKSYPPNTGRATKADHFWPLTQASLVGGGSEGPLHYYGSWKWLVAAGLDLADHRGNGIQPFLYGNSASDKGVANLKDEINRSW